MRVHDDDLHVSRLNPRFTVRRLMDAVGIRSMVDCQARQIPFQLTYSGVGDLSAIEHEVGEFGQPVQMR